MSENTKREMIEIGEAVRVENGPARKTAVATKELLDDAVTASHYKEGGRDAMGKVIVLSEPMMYLDYFGDFVWYLYELEELPIEDEVIGKIAGHWGVAVTDLEPEIVVKWFGVDAAHILVDPWRVMRFMPRGEPCATKDEALAAAKALEA